MQESRSSRVPAASPSQAPAAIPSTQTAATPDVSGGLPCTLEDAEPARTAASVVQPESCQVSHNYGYNLTVAMSLQTAALAHALA